MSGRRGSSPPAVAGRWAVAGLLILAAAGCGRKGAPLSPLPRRPAAPIGLQAVQRGDLVWISFRLPLANQDGSPARIVAVRILRRRTRVEDAAPEQRDHLAKGFNRTAVTAVEWTGEAIETAIGPAGRIEWPDPEAVSLTDPETVLAYRVDLRGAGAGRWTESVPVFLAVRVAPPAPTGLRAAAGPEGTRLEWEALPTDIAIGYHLYRGVDADPFRPRRVNTEPIETTRFVDPATPSPGNRFFYVVRLVVDSAYGLIESGDSNRVAIGTAVVVRPPPPMNLAIAVTGIRVRLFWSPPDGVDAGGFRIYRRVESQESFAPIGEVGGTEVRYTDDTARPGVRYEYRVVSFDRSDPTRESEPTPIRSARVAGTGEPAGDE